MKNVIKQVWFWFIRSSEDPSQWSKTAQNILATLLVYVTPLLPFFHLVVNSQDLANTGNFIIMFIQAIMTAIFAARSVYFLIRKIVNSTSIPWPVEVAPLLEKTEITQG